MNKKLFTSLLAAILMVATIPSAALASEVTDIHADDHGDHNRVSKEEILKLVKEYTPNQLSIWEQEIAKREKLRNELKSFKKGKHDWKQHHEKMKEELQAKVKKGEMTKKEAKQFMEEHHKKMDKMKEMRKQWKAERQKLDMQLQNALKAKDKAQITATLNQMLERMAKVNERIQTRISQCKAKHK